MPRNGSGSCSLAEPPFVPNTPISSADTNSNNDDIITMLTDSLSRSGDGGMQAVLELDNDGFTYTTDPNTGMRRTAGDTQAIECGGVDIIEITPTGVTVTGDLEVTGDITNGGNPLVMIGELWTGTAIPAKWLVMGQTLLRATYPDLWTFAAAEIALGNVMFTNGNGTTTFTVATMDGYVPAGVDVSAARIASFTDVGDTAGAATVMLDTTMIPAHTHVNTLNDPGHTHTNNAGSGGGGNIVGQGTGASGVITGGTNANTTGVTITNAAAGGGAAHANVQPSRAFKFIIYAGA